MTTNEIGYLVDKLAEKAGLAAEAVQPLATELLTEVQRIGVVKLCAGSVAAATGVALLLWSLRSPRFREDPENDEFSLDHTHPVILLPVFVGALSVGMGFELVYDGIRALVAPMLTLVRFL